MSNLELLQSILDELLKRKEYLHSIEEDYAYKDRIDMALQENALQIFDIRKKIENIVSENQEKNKIGSTSVYWNTMDNEIRGY